MVPNGSPHGKHRVAFGSGRGLDRIAADKNSTSHRHTVIARDGDGAEYPGAIGSPATRRRARESSPRRYRGAGPVRSSKGRSARSTGRGKLGRYADGTWTGRRLTGGRAIMTGKSKPRDVIRVAVVGGSIAGWAVAVELTRAGYAVRVFERARGRWSGKARGLAHGWRPSGPSSRVTSSTRIFPIATLRRVYSSSVAHRRFAGDTLSGHAKWAMGDSNPRPHGCKHDGEDFRYHPGTLPSSRRAVKTSGVTYVQVAVAVPTRSAARGFLNRCSHHRRLNPYRSSCWDRYAKRRPAPKYRPRTTLLHR
jgi:hypothetical protein